MRKKLPRVALVGRINAGKSTLFNKLSETTKAIVSPIPGTTRDLNYADVSWQGVLFELIDTGGLDAAQLGDIEAYVQKKAFDAINNADVTVLVVDGQGELTQADREIAVALKKAKKKIIVVLNKIDNNSIRRRVSPDFYKLGLGEPQMVSALNGSGTGDVLDAITRLIPEHHYEPAEPLLRLSIIGKTNVGKSSLLNAIIGEDRVIVTPIPHTTREPHDTRFSYKGHQLVIVDTAGLRRPTKITSVLEQKSAARTKTAIKQSEISLLVTDASQPLSNLDQRIAELACEHRNGILIVVNKWDLIPNKTPQSLNAVIAYYQKFFPHLSWAPIIFVSAKEKQRVHDILDLVLQIHANRLQWLPTDTLEALMHKMRQQKKVGRLVKRRKGNYQLTQIASNPPRFDLIVPRHEDVHHAFINKLEKEMRATFPLNGTAISITLQRKT